MATAIDAGSPSLVTGNTDIGLRDTVSSPFHLGSLPFLVTLARLGSPSIVASVFNVGSVPLLAENAIAGSLASVSGPSHLLHYHFCKALLALDHRH